MKCNDLIADLEHKGNITTLKDNEFQSRLTSMVKKYQVTSRYLKITTHENCEYNLLENLIELSQLNLCDTKEFILEHEVCSDCKLDEIEIELYFYNLYEYVEDKNNDDSNYLSVLLLDLKTRIDTVLGKDAYIDMYVEKSNIIVLTEEKYHLSIEEILRNHCVKDLDYSSTNFSRLAFEETVNIVRIHIIES